MAALLILIGATPPANPIAFFAYAGLLAAALASSRISPFAFLRRALAALPFALLLAIPVILAGDAARALMLVVRAFLSAWTVLLVVATTPAAVLFSALAELRVPVILVAAMQSLYRYLFVLAEQAMEMQRAAQMRSGRTPFASLRGASAALGVLYARSYERANQVHGAMLARGWTEDAVSLAARARRAHVG